MFINHFHVAPTSVFDPGDPQLGTLDGVKSVMRKNDIAKAIAFAPLLVLMPSDDWYHVGLSNERECNEWLYQSLKDHSDIMGFVTANPCKPEAIDILVDYVGKGFVGAKIHPPVFQMAIDDPQVDNYYATAEKLGVPVLFHTGLHGWNTEYYRPRLLDKVAKQHPDLKIVIEHCGGTHYFTEAFKVLLENPNCYAGLTSTLRKVKADGRRNESSYLTEERLYLLVKNIGTERMILGADYPFNAGMSLEEDLTVISSLKISALEKENILGATLADLINL